MNASENAQFGKDFCTEICQTEKGKISIQEAINQYYPILPKFFGRPKSKNNEIYRKWSIKQRTNEDMLADFINRAQNLVQELGLILPDIGLVEP